MPSAHTEKTLGSYSLQDSIRLALEGDIMQGALTPGMAINEQALCARFNASRTPVREALLLLAAKGLISILPRAGIYVRQLEMRELIAMMEGLAELEGVLARLAAHRINKPLQAQLAEALEGTRANALAENSDGYERANVVLHDVIYQASGNAFIVEQTRQARLRVAPYRGTMFEKPERLAQSQAEHEAVVRAILAGDSEGAAQAMRNHISAGGRAFADMVLAAPTPIAPAPRKRTRKTEDGVERLKRT